MLIQVCLSQQLISYTYSTIFLQVGKIKVTAIKAGFENSEDIHCQISALKMTNGIRKVRIGVDIIDKRILNSCNSASEYGFVTAITSLQPAENKRVL